MIPWPIAALLLLATVTASSSAVLIWDWLRHKRRAPDRPKSGAPPQQHPQQENHAGPE